MAFMALSTLNIRLRDSLYQLVHEMSKELAQVVYSYLGDAIFRCELVLSRL
jgi:hypothetical protein